MENEPEIIHQPVTLDALQDAGYSERPEDIRVKAPYRKHVFWLPRRDNAQALVVRIQALITIIGDCNFGTDCAMGGKLFVGNLLANAAGQPTLMSTDAPSSRAGSLPQVRRLFS